MIAANLIPPGEVDERDIRDVAADDLRGFAQHHFFAGIGGWAYALRLAGWPDERPVWTGSCPCQPFSAAGKRKGKEDERHLWPDFLRLVQARRPEAVFGEQVASAEVVGTELEASFALAVRRGDYARANKLAKRLAQSKSFHFHRRWLDGVRADLEREGYAFGASVLGAHSVGAPHIRQRLYWVADAGGAVRRADDPGGRVESEGPSGRREAANHLGAGGVNGRVADPGRQPVRNERHAMGGAAGGDQGEGDQRERVRDDARNGRSTRRVVFDVTDPRCWESLGRLREQGRIGDDCLRAADIINAARRSLGDSDGQPGAERDERPAAGVEAPHRADATRPSFWDAYELVPCRDGRSRRVEPGSFPLADGVPGRVGLLRGYGNAVVPQTAAAFIRAFLEAKAEGGGG